MCADRLVLLIFLHCNVAFPNVCSAALLECIYQGPTLKGCYCMKVLLWFERSFDDPSRVPLQRIFDVCIQQQHLCLIYLSKCEI